MSARACDIVLKPILVSESCSVANQGCQVPANLDYSCLDPERDVLVTCFACGLPVCTGEICSIVREYLHYGPQRICAYCEEDRFPDGELSIRQRAYKQAGYADWFLLGARDYADGVVQEAVRQIERIYRIERSRRLSGMPSTFREWSARQRERRA